MQTLHSNRRAGFSLLEVLVAMFIVLIGTTLVLALFPFGVRKVQQSSLDTRCTLFSNSMWEVVDIKDLTNDPLHLAWTSAGGTDPDPFNPNFLQTPFQPINSIAYNRFNNAYVHVVSSAPASYGADPSVTGVTTRLPVDAIAGVPIMIDPQWVHESNALGALNGAGYNASRQTVVSFNLTAAPFSALPYTPHPMRVVTTWEAAAIVDPAVRGSWIRRWFTSGDDIKYREGDSAIPLALGDDSVVDPGPVFPLSPAQTSAARSYPYSWALIFTRDVKPNPSGTVGEAPLLSGAPINEQALLCFYRRNLSRPYTTAVGAFFNGDNRVTLRYEAGEKPNLRRGGWLTEVLIRYTSTAGETPPAESHGPRRVRFHRIKDFDDAGTNVVTLTIEKQPESGYNAAAGARTLPDPAPGGGTLYTPIVLFDGLMEVYSRGGVWQ